MVIPLKDKGVAVRHLVAAAVKDTAPQGLLADIGPCRGIVKPAVVAYQDLTLECRGAAVLGADPEVDHLVTEIYVRGRNIAGKIHRKLIIRLARLQNLPVGIERRVHLAVRRHVPGIHLVDIAAGAELHHPVQESSGAFMVFIIIGLVRSIDGLLGIGQVAPVFRRIAGDQKFPDVIFSRGIEVDADIMACALGVVNLDRARILVFVDIDRIGWGGAIDIGAVPGVKKPSFGLFLDLFRIKVEDDLDPVGLNRRRALSKHNVADRSFTLSAVQIDSPALHEIADRIHQISLLVKSELACPGVHVRLSAFSISEHEKALTADRHIRGGRGTLE